MLRDAGGSGEVLRVGGGIISPAALYHRRPLLWRSEAQDVNGASPAAQRDVPAIRSGGDPVECGAGYLPGAQHLARAGVHLLKVVRVSRQDEGATVRQKGQPVAP